MSSGVATAGGGEAVAPGVGHHRPEIQSHIQKVAEIHADIKALSKQLMKVEKEFVPVKTAIAKLKVREAENPNPEAAATSVAKILQRVRDVRARTEDQLNQLGTLLFAHEEACYAAGEVVMSESSESGRGGTNNSNGDDVTASAPQSSSSGGNNTSTTPRGGSSGGGGGGGTPGIGGLQHSQNISTTFTRTLLRRDIIEYLAARGHDHLALELAKHYQIPLTLTPSVNPDREQQEQVEALVADLMPPTLPPAGGTLPGKGGATPDNTADLLEVGAVRMQRRNLDRVIAWCEQHRPVLQEENGSLLLVMLRTQELLMMCLSNAMVEEKAAAAAASPPQKESHQKEGSPTRVSGNGSGAVELLGFVAKHLLPFAPVFPNRVQDAATCATHPPQENYKDLYDEVHWARCAEQLQRDVTVVARAKRAAEEQDVLKKQGAGATENVAFPALARHCLAGILSCRDLLPCTPLGVVNKSSGSDSATPEPACHSEVLLKNLQEAVSETASERLVFRRGTKLYCTVTGKAMINPRVLTTTGTVISEEGYKLLIAAAAKEQTEDQARTGPPTSVVCPMTGVSVQVRNVKKMYVV